MIVRIATDIQYRLPDEDSDRLHDLDEQLLDALTSGNEQLFHDIFDEMIDLVRSDGEPLDEEDISQSDVILPPADISFEEAKVEFSAEGLIPDREESSD